MTEKDVTLDVREIAPRERHPMIFGAFDRLPVQGLIRLINDHEAALTARSLDGIAALDAVTLHGPPEGAGRTPTFAVTVAFADVLRDTVATPLLSVVAVAADSVPVSAVKFTGRCSVRRFSGL